MSTKYDGELLKDKQKGKMLKPNTSEGDLLVSEGPKGKKLWKKKKRLDEKSGGIRTLNESGGTRC